MVQVRSYPASPYDHREILRYAGAREDSPELDALLQECLQEAEGVLTYKACWTEVPLQLEGNHLDLGFTQFTSNALANRFTGCHSVVLFAATAGIGLDRLIARYGALSPAKALLFQAIGTERVESLCDAFCHDLAEEKAAVGQNTTIRFSPGYGDVPLTLQRELFRVLDCPRKIGLTLNESLLMSPSKSVTALVGITNGTPCPNEKSGCAACEKEVCAFRRST